MAVIGKKYRIHIVYVIIDFTKLEANPEFSTNAKLILIYYKNDLSELFLRNNGLA